MAITRIKLERFTAFKRLDIKPSPGINIFVGANGTGKTHLMKVAYAACDISKTGANFAEKLIRVYLPSGRKLGRLVNRHKVSTRCAAEVYRGKLKLRISFSNHTTVPGSATVTGAKEWMANPVESVYIPVKEMLSNAPHFKALYAQKEIHFEEIYADILDRAYLPVLRGPVDRERRKLLTRIQEVMEGKVKIKNEEAFLKNRQGDLEFTLLAEGIRKLGLLWLLIQNGTLLKGSILFWDEPETNLNPRLYGTLIDILLDLQRTGVQVFLATHDYVILKEFDLRKTSADNVLFHSLFRDSDGDIQCDSTDEYLQIHPNAIAETFADLYTREIRRSMDKDSE